MKNYTPSKGTQRPQGGQDTGAGPGGAAIATKRVSIQAKLKVSQPKDPQEKEADEVATQTVERLRNSIGQATESSAVTGIGGSRLNRTPASSIESTSIDGGLVAPAGVSEQVVQAQGGGSRMSSPVRNRMEYAMGADLGGVRIHTDQRAALLSQRIQARAFTYGQDIFFNRGTYQPGTPVGQQLLAHELTHTLQQGPHVQPMLQRAEEEEDGQTAGWILKKLDKEIQEKIPGVTLLFLTIEYNPILNQKLSPTREQLLAAVFALGGERGTLLFQRLKEQGKIDAAFQWVDEQLASRNLTVERVKAVFDRVKGGLSFEWSLDVVGDNLDRAQQTLAPLVQDLKDFARAAAIEVVEILKQAFFNLLAEKARSFPAYPIFTALIGFDPISQEKQEIPTAEILRMILRLPQTQKVGGEQLLEKLDQYGLIEKAAALIDRQKDSLMDIFASVQALVEQFLLGFNLQTLTDPLSFLNGVAGSLLNLMGKVLVFYYHLGDGFFQMVKEVSTILLREFINDKVYGFPLVKVLLGKDPITGDPYPRSTEAIIKGFLSLLPAGGAIFEQLKQAGVIDQAVTWIEGAVAELVAVLQGMGGAFVALWRTTQFEDLYEPAALFEKIASLFREPVTQVVAFVRRVVVKLFDILANLMGFPPDLVPGIIANIQSAYGDISQNPIAFLLNLMKAAKEGFELFFDNIFTHLQAGLTDWILRQAEQVGITPPQDLSLGSIFQLVLDILGLQADNLWQMLADRIGPERVEQLKGLGEKAKGALGVVREVQEKGLGVVWQYLGDQISGLWNLVFEQIQDWIVTKIIQAVGKKLLTFLDPTGIMAVINGFQALFAAVQSAVEYLVDMLKIVRDLTGTVVEIAKGKVDTAAAFLEGNLASVLPVAIGFLAKQVGLDKLGKKLKEIIAKVQAYVEKALMKLLDKVVGAAEGLTGKEGQGESGPFVETASTSPYSVNSTVMIGKDEHHLRNDEGEYNLTLHSDPITLDNHPSKALREAYQKYLKDIKEAQEREKKKAKKEGREPREFNYGTKNAANKNLDIITALLNEEAKKAPGASLPGIGIVAPYKFQQKRLQGKGVPVWEAWAEHVIPWRFIEVYMQETRIDPGFSKKEGYDNMTTILIYKGARNTKDFGNAGDFSRIVKMKLLSNLGKGIASLDEGVRESEYALVKETLLDVFVEEAAESVIRLLHGIKEENKLNGKLRGPQNQVEPSLPTSLDVKKAYVKQLSEVRKLISEKLKD